MASPPAWSWIYRPDREPGVASSALLRRFPETANHVAKPQSRLSFSGAILGTIPIFVSVCVIPVDPESATTVHTRYGFCGNSYPRLVGSSARE